MSANWSGRIFSQATPAGSDQACLGVDQFQLGRDEIQRAVVPLHHDPLLRDDLRGMHAGGDRRLVADLAEAAEYALFEVGEAGTLAGAPAPAGHRDAADDAEIEPRHVLEGDRLAVKAAIEVATPVIECTGLGNSWM